LVAGVLRTQFDPAPVPEQSFDGVFAIHHCHDDIVVMGAKAPIHHHLVTVFDTGSDHGVALDREKERRGLASDEVLVQVKTFLCIVGGRGWESSGNPVIDQPELNGRGCLLDSFRGG